MSEGFALVGIKSCGCAVAAQVDDEDTTDKERKQFYRECASGRLTVERWTIERVRMDLRRCKCTPAQNPPPRSANGLEGHD
jgi:hypothetical protein